MDHSKPETLRALARRELLNAIRIAVHLAGEAAELEDPSRREALFDHCENVSFALVEYLRDEHAHEMGGNLELRAKLRRFLDEQRTIPRGVCDLALAHNFAFGFEVARIYLIDELREEAKARRVALAFARGDDVAQALGFAVLAGPPANAVEADLEALATPKAAE